MFFFLLIFFSYSCNASFEFRITEASHITIPGVGTYSFKLMVHAGVPGTCKSWIYTRHLGLPVGCFRVVRFYRCDANGNPFDENSTLTDFDLLGRLYSYTSWIQTFPSLNGKMVAGPSVRYCCYSKAYGTTDIYVNDILSGLRDGDFTASDFEHANRCFHYRSSILGILATSHVSHTWGADTETVTINDTTVTIHYTSYTGKYDYGPVFKTDLGTVEDVYSCPGKSYRIY